MQCLKRNECKLIVILLLCVYTMHAQVPKYHAERLSIDYFGCCTNNNVILACGTGGSITFSTNNGDTWNRKKVSHDSVRLESAIFAFNRYMIITNNNQVLYSQEPQDAWQAMAHTMQGNILSIASNTNSIYIATSAKVYIYTPTLVLGDSIELPQSEPYRVFCALDLICIAARQGGLLFCYDTNSLALRTTTDYAQLGYCTTCVPLAQVLTSNDTLYATSGTLLLRSTDSSKTWSVLSENQGTITLSGSNIISTSAASYRAIPFGAFSFFLSEPTSQKLAGSTFQTQTTTRLQRNLWIPFFRNVIAKGSDTLIGVGANNSIVLSTNTGKSWMMLSCLEPNAGYYHTWQSDKTGYVAGMFGQVYKTTNAGISWLPQVNTDSNALETGSPDGILTDTSGIVITLNDKFSTNEFDVNYSTDMGNSFTARQIKPFRVGQQHIMDGSTYLYIGSQTNTIISTIDYTDLSGKSRLYINTTSKDFQTSSYSFVDSTRLVTMRIASDSEFRGLFLQYNGTAKLVEMQSLNGGKTWKVLQEFATCPFRYYHRMVEDAEHLYFLTNTFKAVGSILKSYFSMHIFNKQSNTWSADSLGIADYQFNGICRFGGSCMITGWDNTDNKPYQSYSLFSFTPWIKSSWVRNYEQEDAMKFSFGINDGFGATAFYMSPNRDFSKRYMYVLVADSLATTVEEEKIEEIQNYLYSFPAYPNPTKNQVRVQIHWDLSKNFDIANISVYSSLGVKVEGSSAMTLTKYTEHNGELVWNCSNQNDGVYYIHMRHGNSSKIIPVAIVR